MNDKSFIIELKEPMFYDRAINVLSPLQQVSLMSFMTFVLSSPDNVLTPEIAFVSLSLFNLIRMPLTSITTLLFSITFYRVIYYSYLTVLSSFLFIFSSSYIDHSIHTGLINIHFWIIVVESVSLPPSSDHWTFVVLLCWGVCLLLLTRWVNVFVILINILGYIGHICSLRDDGSQSHPRCQESFRLFDFVQPAPFSNVNVSYACRVVRPGKNLFF